MLLLWVIEPQRFDEPVSVIQLLKEAGATLAKAHKAVTLIAEGKRAVLGVQKSADQLRPVLKRHGIGVGRPALRKGRMDIKKLRERLGLTQEEFAVRFALPVDSLQNWEQERSSPDPAARLLLAVIDKHPEVVDDVLTH